MVSATRLSQPLNATPAAVTVIDREMIEASGAVELVDILRLVPGFQVTHTHGNLFTVSAHGTGAPWFSRVQVLVSHLFPQQWEASLAWYLADETDWYLDGGLVNGCSRLDLRLAKGFRAGRADGMLELILQNLGSDYEEFTPLNRFETRVLLRGGLQFR